jgi:hypothetical protein
MDKIISKSSIKAAALLGTLCFVGLFLGRAGVALKLPREVRT